MMKTVKTEPWHLHSLNNLINARDNRLMLKIENFTSLCQFGKSVTLLDDGLPIGSFGVVPYWPGVGELWALISDNLRNRPFLLHKTAINLIEQTRKEEKYHRFQAIVLKDFEDGKRWMRHLKFKCEGLMPKYGENKQDYYRFARVF